MSTKKFAIIVVLAVIGAGIIGAGLIFLPSSSLQSKQNTQAENVNQKITEADQIKVYYFHNTSRCASCRALERYTKNTLDKFFQSEMESGKIEFKSINVDKSKNREIARKYGATGSSLFLNKIVDDEDNIEQNTRVWRLLNNKNEFETYLSDEINSYLK